MHQRLQRWIQPIETEIQYDLNILKPQTSKWCVDFNKKHHLYPSRIGFDFLFLAAQNWGEFNRQWLGMVETTRKVMAFWFFWVVSTIHIKQFFTLLMWQKKHVVDTTMKQFFTLRMKLGFACWKPPCTRELGSCCNNPHLFRKVNFGYAATCCSDSWSVLQKKVCCEGPCPLEIWAKSTNPHSENQWGSTNSAKPTPPRSHKYLYNS